MFFFYKEKLTLKHFKKFEVIRPESPPLNILRTKRVFKIKLKVFFIIFKGLSVLKNCLRTETVPLLLFENEVRTTSYLISLLQGSTL